MTETESDRIRRLDATTVERIAAGEVVERPASVVKELVENSLDADASRVDVTVEGGGTERIVVRDDGVGMTEADVRAAVRKHTTSKIADIDDLEAGVATLGFRGEALHTIGAVSRTTVTTKPRDADDAGATELRVEGGEVTHVGPAGRPAGTTVEVEDLFYNTPAREKYLKTESTEFGHVNRVVTRYALANPGVAVSLTHDGTEVFATASRGGLRAALLAVYGREVAESMIEVDAEPADAPVDRVHGYVSHPETTRSTREYVSTFVNGRYVNDAAVRQAVVDAYGGQLAADRFPFAVLFLDVPADEVDVNVHPRKMEVRFGAEEAVTDAVQGAVREALLDAGLVRSRAPRGRSQPGDAPVASDPDGTDETDETDGTSDVDPGERDGAADGADGTDPGRSDVAGDADRRAADRATSADSAAPADRTADAGGREAFDAAGEGRETDDPEDETLGDDGWGGTVDAAAGEADDDLADDGWGSDSAGFETAGSIASSDAGADDDAGADAADVDAADGGDREGRAGGAHPHAAGDRKFRPGTENARLVEDADVEREELTNLPPMRVLGQLHDTYVVAETPNGLVLVDQHAADERINYERLREELAGRADSQSLVAPVELELTAAEAAAFGDALPALRERGFEARREDRTAVVTAVPAVFDDALDPDVLRDALAAFVSEDADGDATVADAADHLLADLACYPSVTGNTSLAEGDVVDLLSRLDDCENPYACPHGRPVLVELDEAEIDDRFERDYPGHQVRRPE